MAERIAEAFSVLGQVEAVALAGSRTSPIHDSVSDWDIYVYAEGEVPVPERERILGSLCPDSMLAGLYSSSLAMSWLPMDAYMTSCIGTAASQAGR